MPQYYQQNGAYYTLNNGTPTPVTNSQTLQGLNSGQTQFQQGNHFGQQTQGGGNNIGNLIGSANVGSAPGSQFVPTWLQDINAPTDPAAYRQNYINLFQDRINSLNQIYDQQLARAQLEGKGRVGQGTAILARRGIAGSPRAGGIQEGILEQNRGIESAIQAERANQIGAIMGQATSLAMEEAAQKRAAKESSTAQYLDYLKGEETRATDRSTKLASQLLEQGFDINEMTQDEISQLVKAYKIDPLQLKNAYITAQETKTEKEFEKEGELLKRDLTKTQMKQIDENLALAKSKFEQDKTQFGMEYALKERAQALDELKVGLEAEKDAKAGAPTPFQQERAFRTVQSVNELLDKSSKNPGIFGRSAALPLPKFARSDAYRDFEAELLTLKSSIFSGELTAMREASKTGGAVGNVSDREGDKLEAALGALSMSQTPENFQAQLKKIRDGINRWQQAIGNAPASGGDDEELLGQYGL